MCAEAAAADAGLFLISPCKTDPIKALNSFA